MPPLLFRSSVFKAAKPYIPKIKTALQRKLDRKGIGYAVRRILQKVGQEVETPSQQPIRFNAIPPGIFADPVAQRIIDMVAAEENVPIRIAPGPFTGVLRTPEGYIATISPPFTREKLLHELGHIKSHAIGIPPQTTVPYEPLIATLAATMIKNPILRFGLPSASLVLYLARVAPYIRQEIRAQRAAQQIGAKTPWWHAIPFMPFLGFRNNVTK